MSISDVAFGAQLAMPQSAAAPAIGTVTSALASFRHLGLAMRFRVVVDGTYDLGHWTQCEGLKVEFKYETIRSGGDYGSSYVLPDHISYPTVKLTRAIESPHSQMVQAWLSEVAAEWQTGSSAADIGTTVTITLLDVYQLPMMPAAEWVLAGAFPVSWTGPTLNAKSLDIATESLMLEHSGFLGPSL